MCYKKKEFKLNSFFLLYPFEEVFLFLSSWWGKCPHILVADPEYLSKESHHTAGNFRPTLAGVAG